jgi:YD repeat-containing protein
MGGNTSQSKVGLRLRDVRSRSSIIVSFIRRQVLAFLFALTGAAGVTGYLVMQPTNAITPPATLGVLSYQKYQTINLTDRAKLLVNLANGNLIVQTNDLNIKSVGPSLNVTRFFNDQATTNGQLGSHGTLSVGDDISITQNANGSATYNGPSGFQVTYPSNGSGGYSTPATYTDSKLAPVTGGGWTLTFNKSGDVYTFNTAGKQTKHANADGLAINYAYNANGTLNTATDTQGKTTTFLNYSGTKVGKISDSTGRYSTYSYTGD